MKTIFNVNKNREVCKPNHISYNAEVRASSERRVDLDWLRVLGVLLLIPFHVALIFVIEPYTIMYIKDTVNSPILASVTGFIHMWHMPVLFIISGYATYFALNIRTARQYIQERVIRLLIPFVFGILTFVPFTIFLQHHKKYSFQEGYFRFFQIDFNHIDGMTGTFTPAHLWFILYLFIFSMVGLPIFLWLRSEKGNKLIQQLVKLLQSPINLFLLGIPLILASATGILGDMNPLYYFPIFLYGFLFASDSRIQQSIEKLTWIALTYGILAGIVNIIFPVSQYPQWSFQWLLLGLIYLMGRWMLTLAVLGLGYRFLNRTSNLLTYASEAAMPFYLLHMTFSVIAGYFVIQFNTVILYKYLVIVFSATSLTVFAYEFVRRWYITRLFFGMKSIKKEVY